MIRRGIVLGVVFGLLLICGGQALAAVVPAGPRLAVGRFSFRPSTYELLSIDPSGGTEQRLSGGRASQLRPLPYPFDAPSWSPDGNLIAYSGLTGPIVSHNGSTIPTAIFVVGADGSGLRRVPGTAEGLVPIFSPDGHTLAFMRERERRKPNGHGGEETVFESSSVWLADVDGAVLRQLTPWRNKLEITPSSFSPDGSTLLVTRRHGRFDPDAEVVAMQVDGSGSRVLARKAVDGVFSPDGSRIAMLRIRIVEFKRPDGGGIVTLTDLFVADADGSRARRLTRTRSTDELWPSWDPSGQRLAFGQLPLGGELEGFGFGSAIAEINPDGSCLTRVMTATWPKRYMRPPGSPAPAARPGRSPADQLRIAAATASLTRR